MSLSIFFIWSCKFDNKLYKKYNSKWSRAHTDKVWHVKFYDYWRTTLTISRDYVHSELLQPTIFQIRHLFHRIALGVPNGTKLWCTDTGLSMFSPREGRHSWGENLIILVIYFTYPVNPFIARSGISQLREFPWDRAEFSDYARLQNWKWILPPNVPNRLFYSK